MLKLKELSEAYHAQPFRRFVIHMADGREIEVRAREFMYLPPPKSSAIIVAQPDGTIMILDILMITGLDFPAEKAKRRKAA